MPRNVWQAAWLTVAFANALTLVVLWNVETLPFHLTCIAIGIAEARGEPGRRRALLGAAGLGVVTAGLVLVDAQVPGGTTEEWLELPLVSGLLIGTFLLAHRRRAAMESAQRMAQERAEALRSRELILQDLSHGLRTPVTIARGHLDVLVREGAAQPEVEIAADELERVGRLVDRLLLLATVEHDDRRAKADIEIDTFLSDLFLRWSRIAPRSWTLGDVVPGTVQADVGALRIALDALIENAVDHTAPGELIRLQAMTDGSGVRFEVTDAGRGIPPERIDRIFDRFDRGEEPRPGGRTGTGLGLAIVRAIATAHGGSCTAMSARGETTFSVWLPGFVASAAPVRVEAAG